MSCASAGLSEPGVEGSNGLSLLGSVDLSDSWKISAALVACVGAVEVVHLPQQNQSSLGPLVALRKLLLLCLGHRALQKVSMAGTQCSSSHYHVCRKRAVWRG